MGQSHILPDGRFWLSLNFSCVLGVGEGRRSLMPTGGGGGVSSLIETSIAAKVTTNKLFTQ